jgi:16S rRNA (cytidine1402-2'-O)-methyltransferase
LGRLYLIPTPIGNARDITQRALDVLANLPLVACEDTRTTRRLLREHGIDPPKLVSYTEHNKSHRIAQLVGQLNQSDLGLVSEAGMPGISDPGQELVAASLAAGHEVTALPGPAAPLAALAASGLPTRRFLFLGFLPRTSGQRRAALQRVAALDATLVIFESPRRVRATLQDIRTTLGDRRVTAAREISKVHEEYLRGSISSVLDALDNPLGEFTLVVEGAHEVLPNEDQAVESAARLAAVRKLSTRDIARSLQRDYGIAHRRAYELAAEARVLSEQS